MNNLIKNIAIFGSGVAVGVLATISYFRHQNEDLAADLSINDRNREREKSYKRHISIYSGESGKPEDIECEEYEDPEEVKEDYIRNKRLSQITNQTSYEDPYVITTEEFAEGMTHYDKLTIYFYEDDAVLADENEEPIIDIDKYIGEESLNKFGEGSEDPEIVYVRNEKLQIDYEVIRLSKSYGAMVLGEPL